MAAQALQMTGITFTCLKTGNWPAAVMALLNPIVGAGIMGLLDVVPAIDCVR